MTRFPESAGVVVDERGTTVLITIDPSLYPEDVVLPAAYWLTDRYHVHVNKTGAGTIIAEIRTKDGRDGPELTAACGTFCNSLIDFALRARVARETHDIQSALVQRAFTELLPKPVSGMANTAFRGPEIFAEAGPYRLMPFQFARLGTTRVLLTTPWGEFAVLHASCFDAFIAGRFAPESPEYVELKSKHFLTHGPDATTLRVAASQWRRKRAFSKADPSSTFSCRHSGVTRAAGIAKCPARTPSRLALICRARRRRRRSR